MAASELTQRCWAIAEGNGRPYSDAKKVYETICDEMMSVPIERHQALAIAWHVRSWKETKNPYHIDAAFMYLASLGGMPTETMVLENAAASALRFNGSPSGTADSIKNKGAEGDALMLMANLIIRGMDMAKAARKAAWYYSYKYPTLKRKKASTLESYYSAKIRKAGIEQGLLDAQRRRPMIEWDKHWAETAEKMPECPEELIGNARE